MADLWFLKCANADIDRLKKRSDTYRLVSLLGHSDPVIRSQAADALSTFGDTALPALINALHFGTVSVRLGVIDFLGNNNLPHTGTHLAEIFEHEKVPEVRLAALITLGQSGGTDAEPVLLKGLRDKNRYIRYSAAKALARLNRIPDTLPDLIYFYIACQDWGTIRTMDSDATGPLMDIYSGGDADTRRAILSVLKDTKNKTAKQICQNALQDSDSRLRWNAIGASMNCGISMLQLPRFAAGHKRRGPDPVAAALLNFLFLGLGYNYIGKWWGFPVFMTYMTIIVLAQLMTGPFLPYLVASPITALLAIHTYGWAVRISEQDV
ncbi:MAG TPA: HEAT repeat domain-containing protein [Methanoregula sp.]|nr:HEAT repeat domain-containing protein [Methanoregula sp.]